MAAFCTDTSDDARTWAKASAAALVAQDISPKQLMPLRALSVIGLLSVYAIYCRCNFIGNPR